MLIAILIAGRSIAAFIIEYEWWKEMGQLSTWESIILYSFVPQVVGGVVRVCRTVDGACARTEDRRTPASESNGTMRAGYAGVALRMACILGAGNDRRMDDYSVFWARSAPVLRRSGAWRDPGIRQCSSVLLLRPSVLFAAVELLPCGRVSWRLSCIGLPLAAGWFSRQFQKMREGGPIAINIENFRLRGGLEPLLLRVLVALVLVGLALVRILARYDFLNNDHGFLVGADYVNTNFGIPLQWMSIAAFVIAALLVAGRTLEMGGCSCRASDPKGALFRRSCRACT